MVNDSFSCFNELTKNVGIVLPIAYQAKEITGILETLDSWKHQYIRQLHGIVTCYKNVNLMYKYAYMKSECSYIHCDVKATFELFIPKVGTIVKGKVNRKSHDYIGCLVHDTINATIDCSCNEAYAVSYSIVLHQMILFEITHLGFKRNIVRLKGKITQECINLMKKLRMLSVEIDDVRCNMLTSTSNASDGYITSEEYEANGDIDLENEDQSQSLLDNNAAIFAENSSSISSGSPKGKRKKSNKLQIDNSSINRSFESSSFKQSDIGVIDSNTLKEDITTDSSCYSTKEKKSKRSRDSRNESLTVNNIEFQNMLIEGDNSTDTSSRLSSSSKKKKYKKTSTNSLNSSSNFSDSFSSFKDEIELFKVPGTPTKKKSKKSQDKFSADEVTTDLKYFSTLLHNDSLNTSMSSQKSKKESEIFSGDHDNLIQIFSSLDPALKKQMLCEKNLLNNDNSKSLDLTEKAEKRKRKSSDKDGLPKKKKKIEESGSISSNTDSKHELKKKRKDKSKKGSKRDKKAKKKVISSKKKLPKLKKKKNEKSEKLKKKREKSEKKKKLKKSSKHKEKSVP